MVDVNTTSMAHSIHFSCHQQFQWVDPKAKNDMFIEYLKGIRLSPPTIILAKDMFGVCHITRQLWNYNFRATYYHEGHTQDQLAEARDSFFSQRTPILVLSLQTDAFKEFVNSARYVLVLDFPDSIDRYCNWKILVNLKDKYGLITSFISNPDLHLLSDLRVYLIMKDEPIPPWLTDKLGQVQSSAKSTVHSHVLKVPILPSRNVIRHADQVMVWPQSHSWPLVFDPPESAYRPDPPIDYVSQSRPCPQVDSPPVFSPQPSNCSDNGDDVPSQSQDFYLDTQADVWISAENKSDYNYNDNHSRPSLDDENAQCNDSDYQHGYPQDPSNLQDHSDLNSSWNSDHDSWFSLENSPGHPSVLWETEASPHEAMPDEQPLAFQPTESPVVMAKELARLQQELPSVQDTLVDERNHFSPVSQTHELEMKAAQLSLAHMQKQFPSTSQDELQVVNGPSCTPTPAYQDELAASNDIPRVQEYSFHSHSLSDISPAQADVSYINPGSLPYPRVDCIQECLDTPVLDGIV